MQTDAFATLGLIPSQRKKAEHMAGQMVGQMADPMVRRLPHRLQRWRGGGVAGRCGEVCGPRWTGFCRRGAACARP